MKMKNKSIILSVTHFYLRNWFRFFLIFMSLKINIIVSKKRIKRIIQQVYSAQFQSVQKHFNEKWNVYNTVKKIIK